MSVPAFLRITKRKVFVLAGFLLIVFTILFYIDNPLVTKVIIGDDIFTVDLAITPGEISKGLGGKTRIGNDEGLLFVFNHKDRYPFWMKGMTFPIDIIWIEDNTIIDITPDVPVATSTPLPTYQPVHLVNKVLEINAGEATRRNINIGDMVTISD